MEKEEKYTTTQVITAIIVILAFFGSLAYIIIKDEQNRENNIKINVDCNKSFSPVYLKPSEINNKDLILNHMQNAYVVIPESGAVYFRTDFLNCTNFKIDIPKEVILK